MRAIEVQHYVHPWGSSLVSAVDAGTGSAAHVVAEAAIHVH